MGQQDIYDVLKTKPNKWHSVNELTQIIPIRRNSIAESIRRMIKSGDVEHKITKGKPRNYCEVKLKW